MLPLPHSRGFTYILTCIHRSTRWPEAIPIPDITTASVAEAFVREWVAHFGVPSAVTTDCGRQFESHLFADLLRLLGVTRIRTTAYHQAANRMVEWFHKQLKTSLRAHNSISWTETLQVVLVEIRFTIKVDIGVSADELVYGTKLRLPDEFLHSTSSDSSPPLSYDFTSYAHRLRKHFRQLRPRPPQEAKNRPSRINPDLDTCTHVFVRADKPKKPLEQPCQGPFKVINRDLKFFTIDIDDSQERISTDRLKPAFTNKHTANSTFRTRRTSSGLQSPLEVKNNLHVYWDRRNY